MKVYFKLLQEELFSAYKSSSLIGHSLPTGKEREIIASKFLERHLPPYVEIGTGVLVDQSTTDLSSLDQTTSPQIDLLLAMKHHPTLTFYGGTRFFFAEAVAAVLEVKSTLTIYDSMSAEFTKVLNHCRKIKNRSRQILGLYYGRGGPSEYVPYYVVAFECAKRVDEILEALRDAATKEGLNDEQRLRYQPDGFFILDPGNSVIVLKHIPDHEIRPDDCTDSCFAGGTFPDGGVLIDLWLTLFQQIENIRLLRFPYLSYAKELMKLRESD